MKKPLWISNTLERLKDLPKFERIYILPTRHGLAFLVALFFLFLIALTYGHSLAFAAAFFLTSLLMSSALFTHLNLLGIRLEQIHLCEVMRIGEFQDIRFCLKNESSKIRYDLALDTWGSESCLPQTVSFLGPFQEKWGHSELLLKKRGFYKAKRVVISTTYPVGLFRAWIVFPVISSVSIAPKAVSFEGFKDRREYFDRHEGETQFISKGEGEDFYQHLPMRKEDSWKKIDWKAWAKKDILLRKENETPSSELIYYQQRNDNLLSLDQQLEEISWWLKKREEDGSLFLLDFSAQESLKTGPASGEKAIIEVLKKLAVLK